MIPAITYQMDYQDRAFFWIINFFTWFYHKRNKKNKTKNNHTKKRTLFANVQISRWSRQDDQVMLRNCFQWDALSFYSISEESWIAFQLLMNCTNHCGDAFVGVSPSGGSQSDSEVLHVFKWVYPTVLYRWWINTRASIKTNTLTFETLLHAGVSN